MSLLTINAGSSSLKLAIYETETLKRKRTLFVERIGAAGSRLLIDRTAERRIEAKDHAGVLDQVIQDLPELFASGLRAIGHRLVHGGIEHAEPEQITAGLLQELRALEHLDPTHMPQALAVIEAVVRRFPDVPQFACFDTAFHRSMPAVAQRYPLPRWTADAGVRRYGFHGLSCESIISQLEQIDARAAKGRLLIAHLGNGASVTAVLDAKSVDTSMGFSPTSGLMMGTRSGDLDPTVMTYLARTRAMNVDALERLVNQEAGLLGVSGTSYDMRDLLERARSDEAAAAALDLYCYLARKQFGALAAALGGVETIVFTGGVGEHAAPVREKICRGLEYLGLQLDVKRNADHEAIISARDSRVVVRVIATDEDLVIARHVVALLKERTK
ncbi:MAG TPA: acetate/propionate family kinase [Tepidisphaeraceae bacterium]|nr:acetate/propionate family kinase [Tepidisphaeraceae bacterium]